MARSIQSLSLDDRRLVAEWAALCADAVRTVFEKAAPGDLRVDHAIAQTRRFAAGELDVAEAIRRRGGQAGAAARDAPTPAATAAAYAAEQAAAVAHMGAHALGAAGYAAKAAVLDGRAVDVTAAVGRFTPAMSDEVARTLAVLPTLGSDGAGPLGPGRLATGLVGDAIRTIQATMSTRPSGT